MLFVNTMCSSDCCQCVVIKKEEGIFGAYILYLLYHKLGLYHFQRIQSLSEHVRMSEAKFLIGIFGQKWKV